MSDRHTKRPHGASSSSKSSRRTTHRDVPALIESLNTHRVNTLTELRRIERVAAESSDADAFAFQTPMTSAWTYYVTSNNLLSELRNLTRNYPFSSDMLDAAKWRVSNDPDSNRSWNYAWLVLVKTKDDTCSELAKLSLKLSEMIDTYASAQANKPEMWGGRVPEPDEAQQLAACFAYEWKMALDQMLRHWETPPTTTGY
ncbi:hypothetical protein HYALB_00009017 [Hymenoscyphus albidus]|uniref:Uncharacterized protein n=1 Tax=Hymenoscyphus albidus TaxID=595503 RepID=A0A9N9LZQ7_9HELO|nr:hypothetical protein HYALB_00009017 [Hymenoscyphus albidus]